MIQPTFHWSSRLPKLFWPLWYERRKRRWPSKASNEGSWFCILDVQHRLEVHQSKPEMFESRMIIDNIIEMKKLKSYSVLVDNVNNSGDLASAGTILKDGDAANFNESVERLWRKWHTFSTWIRLFFILPIHKFFLGFLNQTLICKQSKHVKLMFIWTKVIWMVLEADLSAKIWVRKKILTIFAWRMLWKRRKIDSWHFSIDSLRRVLSVIGHKIFPSFFQCTFLNF